jgi:predicted  nucleic acid-binding Zn-ribbon protein
MQRCNECGNSVEDTDRMCTACRLAEWRHFQRHETEKRLKREALESHRDAYLGRKKAVRDSIRAGVVTAVTILLFLMLVSATRDAMKYEWETKPAMLKANGVK